MRFLAVVLSSGILAACGGGSSTPDTSIAITGTAIKGPMSKAAVNVYKVKADGTKGEKLGQAVSDDLGTYSVKIDGYTGVVIVEAEATAETQMYDEATNTIITPPLGFKMRASFAAESGKSYSTQINPFTEIAATASEGKVGGFSAANVADANKNIAEALRFDPMSKAAEFDAVTKLPKGDLALALAAVSKLAQSDDLLSCKIEIDQAAKVMCVVDELASKGLDDSVIKTALQTRSDEIAIVAGVPTLVISTPSNLPASTASAVVQAKEFMATLRSNAKALDAADLSLKAELQKVSDDVQGRTAPIAVSSLKAMEVAGQATQFWNDVMVTPNATFQQFRNFVNGGGCTFYSDTDYLVMATSKAEAKYLACGTTPERIFATCSAVGQLCRTEWTTRVRLHPSASVANKFTVYSKTRADKYTLEAQAGGGLAAQRTARTEYGAAFPGNSTEFSWLNDSNGNLASMVLNGELSPAFSIDNGVGTVLGDKHNVALNGALTKASGVDTISVSGSIDLIKGGVLETGIALASGSYIKAAPDANGSYDARNGSQEMLIKMVAKTAASAITGDLKIGAFKSDVSTSSYIPTEVSFTGAVQRNGVSFFEGTLTGKADNHAAFNSTLARSNSNPQILSAGFLGKVTIPTRPVMTVSLSGTHTDTGSLATNTTATTGQYTQGAITINLSGLDNGASNVTTLTSTSGLKLVVDSSKSIYPITQGVESVGTYSTTTKRIDFLDGSFQQF